MNGHGDLLLGGTPAIRGSVQNRHLIGSIRRCVGRHGFAASRILLPPGLASDVVGQSQSVEPASACPPTSRLANEYKALHDDIGNSG